MTGCGHSIERPLKPPFMICQNKPPTSPHKTSFTSAHSERTHKDKKNTKRQGNKFVGSTKSNASAPSAPHPPTPRYGCALWLPSHRTAAPPAFNHFRLSQVLGWRPGDTREGVVIGSKCSPEALLGDQREHRSQYAELPLWITAVVANFDRCRKPRV